MSELNAQLVKEYAIQAELQAEIDRLTGALKVTYDALTEIVVFGDRWDVARARKALEEVGRAAE